VIVMEDAISMAAPVMAVALGLIFGSFANVCIHRIPLELSVVRPGSRCPGCGKAIAWFDNIPVVSWLLLRARCRKCSEPIHWRYPLVELLMGAGFLLCYIRFGTSLEAVAAASLTFACVVLTFIDIDYFLLPDVLTLGGLGAGLGFAVVRGVEQLISAPEKDFRLALGGFLDVPVLPLAAVVGAVAGASMPLLARSGYSLLRRRGNNEQPGQHEPVESTANSDALVDEPGLADSEHHASVGSSDEELEEEISEAALREGMGLGDVKMLGMVGAFLGAKQALVTILIGSISGTLLAVPWLILSGKGMKTPIPFGPFLALGAVIALFAGEELSSAYSDFVRRFLF
jgi:leader peptidase (prepilin peptidase)/N-methyltransferase